jgi:hypothetical protein
VAQLSYPTEIKEDGPWLISAEQLERLDAIVDIEVSELRISAEARLSTYLNERIERWSADVSRTEEEKENLIERLRREEKDKFQIARTIQFYLSDGKKLQAGKFAEASLHPETMNCRITRLEMQLSSGYQYFGGVDCALSLGRFGDGLRLSVEGRDEEERYRLFNSLRRWVEDARGPAWQRYWIWTVSKGIHWLVFFIIGAVISSSALYASTASSPYVEAAHSLLSKGVTTNDTSKALEIILALQSKYKPGPIRMSMWPYELWFAAFIFCVILSIRPKLEIGVGKGRHRIRRWKMWSWLVAVYVPGLFFTTMFGDLMHKLFSGVF